ncbi:hypothetical protein JD844_020724 [Phrynosoma platyrhinos]|uniref:EML-like first beta-propeller domain-containing protein n=1 Tax=Phrynosoma platyrhinos TaxID=52577 RepID=A0ABQ7SSR8_PHRPL|nr:hypothetical protein JD844_020724 [Phrynosoma platyrhinos]
MEVTDRIASLEQRVQMQEDDIQLLKSALADVVRRLNITEEQQAMQNKKGPTKARPLVQTLPLKTTVNNGTVLPKKPSGSLPSPSGTRKEIVSPAAKSTVKRTNSAERVSPGGRRESYGDSKGSRNRAGSTSSSSSGKKNSESKPKEPMFSAGKRRVTHCKEEGYVKMFLRGRPVTMYMPKDQVESYNLEAKAELPAKRLKLEWVYGYRGRDCRSNLYLLPTGETVYFIASVVVLYNVEEQLQRHYTGHNDDVKCLAVHPDRITIATGQVAGTSKDGKQLLPHVRIWDSVTLNTLHVIGMGFFDRAVTCIAFSKSVSKIVTSFNGGSNLCSVDDSNDHVLSVWDWQREEKLADVKCSNEAVFAADFHPTDTNIIVTCGKSHLYFWTLEGNSLIKKQGLFEKQEKPKFVLCVTFSENGDAITGDSSGNILVWGKGTNRISSAVQGAHEGGIFALCMLRDGTLVSGGGKDRKLISWNGNYQKLHKTEIPEQFGPIRTIAEGKSDIVLIGTTRNFVLQGSLSGDFSPITQGHSSFITHLDWSTNSQYLVSNSGDYEILYWVPSSCKQVVSVETTRDIEWVTYTCTLGFHVFGEYLMVLPSFFICFFHLQANPAKSSQKVQMAQILMPFVAHMGRNCYRLLMTLAKYITQFRARFVVATTLAADFILLLLMVLFIDIFQAPSHVYGGHSSHVTNVDFLYEDSHLISTGGKDTSIMQWRVI